MDGALLKKSKRQQTEMKRGGWGGGPLQLNHHIFSLVRDIIYTNPLKGQEHSMRCQLQQPIHFFFLFLSVSLSFCRHLCRSVSRSIPSFPSVFTGRTPVTADFRCLIREMLVCVRVCYSKTVCLLAILVFIACGWHAAMLHSCFNVSHPHLDYGQKTERGREQDECWGKDGLKT